MSQLNIHLTPEFEKTLSDYMNLRGIKTKSDAVRQALQEAVEREKRLRRVPDFTRWVGMGKLGPENPTPKFRSDDDLWS